MLQEIEAPLRLLKERTPLRCDTVVVGSGITGLLLAKKLTDLGQSIILIDSNQRVARGSSTKNHGWLHRGTVHAVSIPDKSQAKKVVQKLVYGHEYIKSYAGECLEDPFEPVYVTTQSSTLAQKAVELWDDFGVQYEEVGRTDFYQIDSTIKQDRNSYFFKSSDLRINNRILFQKLLADIKKGGGMVATNAEIQQYQGNGLVVRSDSRRLDLTADAFVYCTGPQLGQEYLRVTGQKLELSFWKSHLLYLPRFNPFSVVSIDKDGPVIINHREVSVINRGYDDVQCDEPDYSTDTAQAVLSFESLKSMYPIVETLRGELRCVPCIKPSVELSGTRHNVDSQILQPLPNHFFVLPGKMTEAPYLVDELIHALYERLDFSEITERPIDEFKKLGKNQSPSTVHQSSYEE